MRTHSPLLLVLPLLLLPACMGWADVDRDIFGDVPSADAAGRDGAGADALAAVDAPATPDLATPTDRSDGGVAAEDAPAVDALEPTDAPDVAAAVDALDVAAAVDGGPPADAPDASVAPVDVPPPVDVQVTDARPVCGPLEGVCGGACTALLLDPRHCGACGRSCPGGEHAEASCNGGRCELVCTAGFIDCGGGCQDARTDVANCGACGRNCPDADHAFPACTAGRCALACATGYVDCDGERANGCESAPGSDVRNCGGCGRRCAAGQTCGMGVCRG